MTDPYIHIEGRDCLPFASPHATAAVLQEFIESQRESVFWITPGFRVDEEARLAEYDYRQERWVAGRFVGEAIITSDKQEYKISIKPRFGEKQLFRMLETIFNVQITESAGEHAKKEDWQHYIKRIITYIWLQKLANANLHGMPKKHVRQEYKGTFIKGKLAIRQSVQALWNSNQVVSYSRTREIDPIIAHIIHQAYSIIRTDFAGGVIKIRDSAQDAINQVSALALHPIPVSEKEYRSIRYKEIYAGWKSLVDFSWDIIRRKHLSLKQNKSKKGVGFFIDMAEVWEQYLRSILKKGLAPSGWQYHQKKQIAYPGYFYQRELIPDLVFQRGEDVAIWDAKYKRMRGRYIDVDRADFFQIHTYIQHLAQYKNVKAGGLLYPICGELDLARFSSPYLLHTEGRKMNFSIDGIVLSEENESLDPTPGELAFLTRIIETLE